MRPPTSYGGWGGFVKKNVHVSINRIPGQRPEVVGLIIYAQRLNDKTDHFVRSLKI